MTTNSKTKLLLAQGFAIAAVVTFSVFALGTSSGLLPTAGRGLIFPVIGILLSVASFILSWGLKSIVISVLLVAGGLIQASQAVAATWGLTILAFPGPITGVIVGLAVLGLGIAKWVCIAYLIRTRTT